MKHFILTHNEKKKYKEIKKEAQKSEYKSLLIQIYFGITDKKKIKHQLQKIKKDFSKAVIIGATTAGEIAHAKMYEKDIVLSFSFFSKTKLKATYTKEINGFSGEKAAKSIYSKNTKAAIVLSEGLHGEDYESFVKAFNKQGSDVIVAGGLAGDNFQLKKSYVVLNDKIYEKGAVAISFSSKKLFASNQYNLNWRAIGKKFRITEVDGNVVKKIDNIAAVDFFKKYLGEEILAENGSALANFQLLFNESGTTVARTPLAIEKKDIIFAGPIKQGQEVQFGFSNESSVLLAADELREDMAKAPAEAIYIFSCIARKTLLGKTLEEEFSSFEDIAPTAGFFTYGEFYSNKKKNILLNCTTTILILSEKNECVQLSKEKNKRITRDAIIFDALSHFIKQTSAELEQNVRLMNQYKEVVDVAFLVSKTDKNGNITYVNKNFSKVSQYKESELLGKNHNIVRDPDVSSFVFKKMWQTITAGKVYRGKFSNMAKDGTRYYVDATIMPIFDEDGIIQEFIAVRQNITKQVLGKIRMQEKERLIRAIFDNQESIVIQASKIDGMQSVNKKFFDYFSFTNFEDFKAKHSCICDLFIEEEGYIYTKKYPKWLEMIAEDEQHDYKVKMRAKNGKIHIFTLKVKPIENEYIINLYDITKLEEALLKAYSSEKAKAVFLANMSHEIRTPLNGILGFTDLLSKKDLDSETQRYINIIHKSGETLLNVVNDILDFSKIESGELTLYKIPSDLFEAMEVAVSTFASVSKKKKINYYVFIDTAIPKRLECDVQRLKQVMSNLISNAIKFTPEDGEVFVKVVLLEQKGTKAKIHFSVKDSGIGIAKEKIATVFQAFSQADNSISREYGGTGLGLAISNQYIEMMGSHIELKSELNKGSEFSFDLEFEVVDATLSVDDLHINNANIAILNSYEGISCGINEIVYQYLDGWQCRYKEINAFEEIDSGIDVLIVCAKMFNAIECQNLLQRFSKLELIYIEGSEHTVECSHPRYHLIEQPMTGSSLFDKLISLMDKSFFETKKSNDTVEQIQHYSGSVLVAEDNETNQMLISILLEERGIDYKIVENGQEVLNNIAKGNSYSLIFMDINMPVLDGINATRALREKGYKEPIVSLSANVIESDTKAFKEAGMDDVLKKPIVPAELESMLVKYLKPQQEEEIYDEVDIQKIAKSLSFSDTEIVIKLLGSLAKTFKNVLENLEAGELNKELIHKLRGAAGNMRFDRLYKLSSEIEENIENLTEGEVESYKKKLIKHLHNALENIAKL